MLLLYIREQCLVRFNYIVVCVQLATGAVRRVQRKSTWKWSSPEWSDGRFNLGADAEDKFLDSGLLVSVTQSLFWLALWYLWLALSDHLWVQSCPGSVSMHIKPVQFISLYTPMWQLTCLKWT